MNSFSFGLNVDFPVLSTMVATPRRPPSRGDQDSLVHSRRGVALAHRAAAARHPPISVREYESVARLPQHTGFIRTHVSLGQGKGCALIGEFWKLPISGFKTTNGLIGWV